MRCHFLYRFQFPIECRDKGHLLKKEHWHSDFSHPFWSPLSFRFQFSPLLPPPSLLTTIYSTLSSLSAIPLVVVSHNTALAVALRVALNTESPLGTFVNRRHSCLTVPVVSPHCIITESVVPTAKRNRGYTS